MVVNTAPVLGLLAPITVNEGATANVTLTATDAENDPLTFTVMNAPAFVSQMGAALTIAPGFTNSGMYSLTIIVSDGQLQAQGTLSITVVNVNRAPVLMPVNAVTMTAGTTQQVTFIATDPDGDMVTLSLTNAPPFGNLMGSVLTLSPAANVVDSRSITVTATDPSSATDNETFQLTVNPPANQAPVLTVLAQVDASEVAVAAGAMVATTPQLRGTVDDPENAQVRIEAEVILTSATFTNAATHTGALSAEGVLTLPLSSLSPGAYKWQLRALDAAGTASAWQQYNSGNAAFTLIAGSISGTLQVNGNAAATNNASVTLSITASTTPPATVTELCFSNDGVTFIDCGAPVTMKTWPLSAGDGTKTVRVRVRNSLNQTLVLNDSIVLDTVAPQVSSFTVNANAAATNMNTVSLSWVATDALTGVASQQASNNGTTFSNVSASPAVFMLGGTQGQVTVSLRVSDVAGNQTTVTDTIFFDTASPTISSTVLNAGNPWTRFTSVNLAVTAADGATSSGLYQVCVSGDVTPGCLPYAAQVPVTLTPGGGSKTVLVTVSDNAGNVSLASMASVGLDQATPALVSVSVNGGAAFTNSANVTVSTIANDLGGSGLSQIQCRTDGGAFSAAVAYNASVSYLMAAGDGLKSVECKVIDGAGNESAVTADGITLDTGAPTGTFVINAGNPAFTNNINTTLVFSPADGTGAGVTHRCVSATGTPPTGPMDMCFQPIAFTSFPLAVGDGLKTLSVWFRDGANNVSAAPATDSITLDTVAPTISVMGAGLGLAGGASSTNSLTPVFNHLASDATSGLAQVCTGEVFPPANCVPYTATPTASLTAGDGGKTVFIRVIDGAGNISATPSDVITLDQTPPTVTGLSINGGATYTNNLTVSLTSVATDAVQMQLSFDGALTFQPAVAYGSPVNTTLPPGDGSQPVHMRVIDAAGNVSGNSLDSIIIDTTPPTTTININSSARYTQVAAVTVTFAPSESGSGLAQRCLKEAAVGAAAPASPTAADPCFVTYTPTAMHTLAAQGDRRVYGWVLDGAGNVSATPATYDIFYDSVAPTAPSGLVVTPAHRQLTIAWTNALDASSGVQGYEVGLGSVSGGPYVFGALVTPGVGTTSVTLPLPNGVAQFVVVRAKDNAGNTSVNSTQSSGTPRWPFAMQNRPASGMQLRGIAYHSGANRYFVTANAGGLYSSDDAMVSFTRRDPRSDANIDSVYVDGNNDVWVVGVGGHLARSTDDGVTFSTLVNNDTALPKRDLLGFTYAGQTGTLPLVSSWWVAVGNAGRIVRGSTTLFNAVPTFDVVTSPTSANLTAVARCSSSIGGCSGAGVLIAVGTAGVALRSTDNGATWSTLTLPAGYTTTLTAVVALPNTNTIYIGGVTPSGHGALLTSNNGGVTFTEVSGFADLTEVSALAAVGTELWGVGRTPATLVFRYATNTRTDMTLPAPSNQTATSIVARSATEIATAGFGGDVLFTSAPPTFVKRNLGASSNTILKMSMPPTYANSLWASGLGGMVLFSSNAGATWTQQGGGPLTSNTIDAIEAVDVNGTLAGTLVFAAGAAGAIWKSTNGGTTWAPDPDTGIVTTGLIDLSCRSSTSCLAVGSNNTVLTWNSANWVVTSTGGARTWRAVAAWTFNSTNRAVVVGSTGGLQTQTGTTWTARPDINAAIDFRGVANKSDGAGIVIAVGTAGSIYKSTDFGATFTQRTSGVAANFEDITNVAGTSTWYAVGGGGMALKSTDDGETWAPLLTNSFDAINSVCAGSVASRVWLGSTSGTILFSSNGGL